MTQSSYSPQRNDSTARRRSILQVFSSTAHLISPPNQRGPGSRRSSRPSISTDRIRVRARRENNPEEEVVEPPPRPVIFNEEIEKLRIKLEDLEKITKKIESESNDTPRETSWKPVLVRKEIPVEERRPKMKSVLVLRKAPHDAETQIPSPLLRPGPKFDHDGQLVPHSILGSVEEFQLMDSQRRLRSQSERIISVSDLSSFSSQETPWNGVRSRNGMKPRAQTCRPAIRRVRWHDSPHTAPLLRYGVESRSSDSLPYWAPRDRPGLPVGSFTRLPSCALVSAVRPSSIRLL